MNSNIPNQSGQPKTVFKVKDPWWIVITVPLLMVAVFLAFTYVSSQSPFDFVKELPMVLFVLFVPGVLGVWVLG